LVRTLREKGCTIVILGDLDHFKSINDTHGHLVGDEVLREAARRLLGSVRSYDFVGRYGGEEFLLVLNNCDTSRALLRAEEIRKAVAESPIQTARGPLTVTLSMGVLSSRDWNQHSAAEFLCEVRPQPQRIREGQCCVRSFRGTAEAGSHQLTGCIQERNRDRFPLDIHPDALRVISEGGSFLRAWAEHPKPSPIGTPFYNAPSSRNLSFGGSPSSDYAVYQARLITASNQCI
jgi:diguanylate cyclase (GGDEF)-like protein